MKNLLMVVGLLLPGLVIAEQAAVEPVQQTEQQGVFKGLMYKVWNRFRALSPRDDREKPDKKTVATAGIRGAETTSSILQPYWKDDRSSDPRILGQLNAFADAQALVDRGQLQQASEAFKNFIDNYPTSDLRPNAQFAIGMAYGGLGQAQQGAQAFQVFIHDNPDHPLVADARMVMEELK
jgi:TolA-binding protein